MKTFRTFALDETSTPGKNAHMTHIEDLVLYGGVDGARQAIVALRSLRNMLAGESVSSVDVSQKWDGAPAVIFGEDPADGKFFVATKSIFNKNPKVYKTRDDINARLEGDLAKKMRVCLEELPKLGVKGIVQGDLLFTKGDLKLETINGLKYLTFHPNTIVYAVPALSDAANMLQVAKLGIVLHTTYTGKSFETLKASYGVQVRRLTVTKDVWVQDAILRNVSGTATMTQEETDKVTQALSAAGKIFNTIAGDTLREIEKNPHLAQLIEQFNNIYVRKGQRVTDTADHVRNLISWIHDKVSDKSILSFFSPVNSDHLKRIFYLQNAIVDAKLLIIRKLDEIKDISTFVQTRNGFRTTGSEGFVAIDRIGKGAVKLVDRMEFSTNNFNPDIIKGW